MAIPEQHRRLLDNLMQPSAYPHPVERCERLETHASWVLLAGEFAYKVKKPVDFGFLDYSTLERRRAFCELELALNRRTAPQLYLEVVPVTGSPEAPRFGGDGPAIEYAVRMRRFDQSRLASRLLAAGALRPADIDAAAEAVARFHRETAPAPEGYGTPEAAFHPVAENFVQLQELVADPALRERLAPLRRWAEERFAALRDTIERRRREGRVRECHGDLHLNNIVLLDGRPTPFDCIEFNPNLRYIDTVSEIAFLAMDLDDRGRGDLANRFVDRYLERSGDYGALPLLRFYQGYRAMVRAKVAAIRLADPNLEADARAPLREELSGYLALAERYTAPQRPRLLVSAGPSGSGKSVLAERLVERFGALRLRSDVVRKGLFGLDPQAHSAPEDGLYAPEVTEETYERLEELAARVLAAGFPAVVDATCLRRAQRRRFIALAQRMGVCLDLLLLSAPTAVLEERITRRQAAGGDPSEADAAVLHAQLEAMEPPENEELHYVRPVDSSAPEAFERALETLAADTRC